MPILSYDYLSYLSHQSHENLFNILEIYPESHKGTIYLLVLDKDELGHHLRPSLEHLLFLLFLLLLFLHQYRIPQGIPPRILKVPHRLLSFESDYSKRLHLPLEVLNHLGLPVDDAGLRLEENLHRLQVPEGLPLSRLED